MVTSGNYNLEEFAILEEMKLTKFLYTYELTLYIGNLFS